MTVDVLTLAAPASAADAFAVTIEGASPHAKARRFRIEGPASDGRTLARSYDLGAPGQSAYLDLFAAVSRDFGTRLPLGRRDPELRDDDPAVRPLLTANLTAGILYGYGDPSVLRVPDGPEAGWWLVVTSNDAPDAFPLLHSPDLEHWRHTGFAFPHGREPSWTLSGLGLGDFWAAELHQVGEAYWLVYAARERDRTLSIGLARAPSPSGPWIDRGTPLVRGGVIDPHIAHDSDGRPWLFWKRDENAVWPRLLSRLLHETGAEHLFLADEDRRTAALTRTLWPWIDTLEPMEQFFLLQPLIEAASEDLPAFSARLQATKDAAGLATLAHAALTTRVLAQRLTPDGELTGEPRLVLTNDQIWEAHLIEGVWIQPHAGRYHAFYAGNDFATPRYAIGAAVSDRLLGPYHKQSRPLMRTGRDWIAPGHPSVADGPDGRPWLFLHAYPKGVTPAYKAFRALLAAPLDLNGEVARLA